VVDISNNLVDIWFFFWWSIFDKTPVAALVLEYPDIILNRNVIQIFDFDVRKKLSQNLDILLRIGLLQLSLSQSVSNGLKHILPLKKIINY